MFSPDIFADRDADLFAAEIQRRNRTRRLEITVFIENIIGRQKGFVCFANWLSRFEEGCSIMKWFAAALIPIDKPDEQRCPTNMLVQLLQDFGVLRNEARFENKVLWRVTSDGESRC